MVTAAAMKVTQTINQPLDMRNSEKCEKEILAVQG